MRKLSPLILSTTLTILALPVFAQQFKVGDRVDADVMHIGIWKSGSITEVLPFDRYRVQLDEDLGRHEPTVCLLQFIKARTGSNSNKVPQTSYTGSNSPSGQFKIGQRVMADATQIGNFKAGTITELLPFGRFKVQFDDEIGRYEPTVILEKYMKAAENLPPPNQPGKIPQAAAGKQTATHTADTSHETALKQGTAQAAAKPATSAAEAGEGLPAGKGSPPNGKYVAQKISPGGQLMGLGELEIRGNTYKGIAGGSFAPFTLSGGNINWSAGITGLPDGWVIRQSMYRGLDHMGRPYIQVYYRSKSGFNDCFDCVRE